MSNLSPENIASLRELIRTRLVETSTPSLALAVAQETEILWEEGFGWANREDRIPATPHTLYSLASITKPITATGLMILSERGQIDLDAPANDYLGEIKLNTRIGNAQEVTIRHIAAHNAGLPLHYHFFFEDEPHIRPPMDETIRRYANLITPPGETYRYANLGYGILDYIISRVSGKSYADFIREEIFIPLNMPHASIDIGPGLEPHCATRYSSDGKPIPFYTFDHPGGSAAFCSAHDLVRFGLFHLKTHLPDQKRILQDQTINTMQTPIARINETSSYGIGWFLLENEGGYQAVRHDGNMAGVRTRLILVPSEKLAVVVLVNTNEGLPPQEIATEILAYLLPDFQKRPPRLPSDSPTPPPFDPPTDLLGTWSGTVHTYNGPIPFTLEFQPDGDIHARLGDQLKTLVNNPRVDETHLTGKLLGDLGTEDAAKHPYHLHLDLHLRGNLLNGAISAVSLPNPRYGNALSHWTELKKQ
ncbi:MAG: serine hydrolase [bacterium]|nr:serine hydrolase [bacterium]